MKFARLIPLLIAPSLLLAGSADEDWNALIALDAGPQRRPGSPSEIGPIMIEHLGKQERALRGFLRAHSQDPHAFEAKLRLARALQLKADVQDARIDSPEVEALLADAERTTRPEQRAEVRFARVSYMMRRLRTPDAKQRQHLYDLAKSFQASFPDDRRLAALLTEVATRFDHEPKRKRALLVDAQLVARDEELKARIADDLKRLDLLGEPIALRFQAPDGDAFDVATHRGKVVVLIFFAAWSQPSIDALATIEKALPKLPADHVQLFGVSLDNKREPLEALAIERKITWPVICDGRAWESPLVRGLGINTVPTVWLLDREGRLRSLDGLEGLISQVRELLPAR
ncbi:MAG: TlpA disulfide reductase family protein [Chthoniobacteraceae bacterium]